jgi:hypothetical protein
MPVWLALGLLDQAYLLPARPIDARALADAPFLDLLHPSLNAAFVELLGAHPGVGTAVARFVVDDLAQRADMTQIGALIRRLRRMPFDEAFGDVYGRSLDAYARELRQSLSGRRPL